MKKIQHTRRNFLKNSILTAGSTATILSACANQPTKIIKKNTKKSPQPPAPLKEIQDQNLFIRPLTKKLDKSTIKLGVIGVGGRGAGALMNCLAADPNIQLWAIGDIKPLSHLNSRAKRAEKKYGKRGKLPAKKLFSGFDAYKKVIDSGVDMVILATPPAFRPLHIKAAVEAKKHIFAEKPLAIDATGLRSVINSAKIAQQKKLSFMTGFCWRYTPATQDIVSHLLNQDFGKIITVFSQYLAGGRPNALSYNETFKKNGTVKDYIYKWQNYLELAGDSIVEQSIHSVDKLNWLMGTSRKVKCFANGGQAVPYPANSFDNFSVIYQYDDGRQAIMTSRQIRNASGGTSDRVHTDQGFADTKGTFYNPKTKRVWKSKLSKKLGYVNEHAILISYIRANKVFDDSYGAITSTGMAIMGRMAAYTGKRVSWKKLINSKEKLFDDSINYFHNMPYSIRDLAIPGITKLI